MIKRKDKKSSVSKLWKHATRYLTPSVNVYFISGMCYNCTVFDNIILPPKHNKTYIEWKIPQMDESIEDYACRMAQDIDRKKKNILVGYSFGGVIVQEIAKILNSEKVILISTMKSVDEIPSIFNMAKKINFAENLPMRLYKTSNFMINLFNRYVYSIPTSAIEGYMTVLDPIYIKWSLREITRWTPPSSCSESVYHIHGTRDQVFPYNQIQNPMTIKGGDHLMVIKRAEDINAFIANILNK